MTRETSQAEWHDWADGLPTKLDAAGSPYTVFPDPYEVGGLPVGWRTESRLCGRHWRHDLVLVRCGDGLWSRVYYTRPTADSLLGNSLSGVAVFPTVLDMYDALVDTYDPLLNAMEREAAAQWIRHVLLRSYDLNDEAEAAEATLVGLGARPRVSPAALG